ncbi:MAG: serine hydrolase domain-containing protein, partial [Myxococcota bacterium]
RWLSLGVLLVCGWSCASSPQRAEFSYVMGTRDAAGEVQLSSVGVEAAAATEKPWQWASVTKQFVAVLIMQEVEAGRLALDDTLGKLLPEFASKDRSGVTVEQLLRHTSGLGEPEAVPTSVDTDPLEFCDLPVRSAPGEAYDYNNCDTAIAAEILETVSGQSWAELLRTRILGPAGMNSSGVLVAPISDGSVVTSGAPHLYGASAAMFGTLRDLLAFNDKLMSGALLSPASLELLWDGDPKIGFVALGAWEFDAELEGCDAPVRLVERRGDVGRVQVVNVMAPKLRKSFALFTRAQGANFGEIWTRRGTSYARASETFCSGGPVAPGKGDSP